MTAMATALGGLKGLDEMLDEELADVLAKARADRHERCHCAFCGAPCWGYTCQAHTHLALIEKRARGEAA